LWHFSPHFVDLLIFFYGKYQLTLQFDYRDRMTTGDRLLPAATWRGRHYNVGFSTDTWVPGLKALHPLLSNHEEPVHGR
jgi:hypothetical protein